MPYRHRDADQYGEVVVEGDFEGDAAQSDAGAAEAAEPEPEQLADSRVWGIDNDALEALKAKTCALASRLPVSPSPRLPVPRAVAL